MAFSFLNPWFWLAALAVAAPVWLHLHHKKQTDLVRFSALRFLEEQPVARQGPLRLRDMLLFLLRVLGLLLLVSAFAWPYLRGVNTDPVQESRVYILDNTLSHQADNGFNRDRDRILSELGRSGYEVQAAVIELTASPQVLVSFGDDRENAGRKLRALQPSFQRGSYLAAFRQANSLLTGSLGARRRIIFLGDNQENQWNENVNTPPFLQNIEVELPKPRVLALPNVSLSEPRVQRIFMGDKSLLNFTAKLTHSGEARSATVILRANDQVIFNRPVDWDPQPGSILLQAQWESDPAAWVRGELVAEATPDALPADNRLFFCLAPVIEGKVALLAQSPYLRLALSPDIMRGQWATRFLEPSKLAAEMAADRDADVLCLESNYLQSGDARQLLSRYLSHGRGVLLLVNRVTPAIRGYLRELGFETEGAFEAPKDHPERFQFLFSNHPIFHPFLSAEYGNLMDVKIFKYVRLRSGQAMPLAFSEDGTALFFQGAKAPGKLFVGAFGMDRDQTSWPIHQTFIPFLDLALQAARAEDPTPVNFEPAEIGQIQLPVDSLAREVVLRDDHRELARAAIEQGRAQLRMPGLPGVYSLTYDDRKEVQRLLSINPSPKESQLNFVDQPEALSLWRVAQPAGPLRAPAPSGPARVPLAGILQQRLWWWMVVSGLVALLIEMAIAETRKAKT